MNTLQNNKYKGPRPIMFTRKHKVVTKYGLVYPGSDIINEDLSWYELRSAEYMQQNYFPEMEILQYEKEMK